ncbi:group III truncated hemoglobin [Devosia sp. ZB163]|uniref:group III truncated hemoglobin n=1 Tax=Devosia sp. ZB163 TaxID=3025938 RepID=UPI002360587A|nr:group III truncated hemoglobin [Devosia sp. ZB163]MDC9822865.1 group III truncated hemoglobin [Devosia sp. ZB163]
MDQPAGTRLHPSGRLIPPELDEAMVRAVVESFYAKARRDDVIGPVFNRVIPDEEWPAHLDKITDFWSSMLLGTGRYRGRPMPAHIAIPELADPHFQRWLSLFRMTVEELCPPAVAALFVERAEVIGNNFRLRIAQFRGEDPHQLKLMRAGTRIES